MPAPRKPLVGARARLVGATATIGRIAREPLTQIAAVLIALQLGLRAWFVSQGWFYADDFEFLIAHAHGSYSLSYLFEPHDSQLMPAGRLLGWWVASQGSYAWWAAAVTIVGLQATASIACWWALRAIFGPRPWLLALLAFYLFSALTVPTVMWWAAAINVIPAQTSLFAAIGLYVSYLRTRRVRWLILALLALTFGLAFYVKAALAVLPLAGLTLIWPLRASLPQAGSTGSRALGWVRAWCRANWLPTLIGGGLIGAYAWLYIHTAPSPLDAGSEQISYLGLLDVTVRVSLVPALVGGPWRWAIVNPPRSLADPPDLASGLALAALAVAATVLTMRYLNRAESAGRGDLRRRLLSAVLLVVPYFLASFVLTAQGRGQLFGELAVRELRYLSDLLPLIVIAIGMAVRAPWKPTDTDEAGGPDLAFVAQWRRLRERRPLALAALALAVLAGSAYSSITYVRPWNDFAARTFVTTVRAESAKEPMLLADVAVPAEVLPGIQFPANLPSELFAPLGRDRVEAVDVGNDLDTLDATGQRQPAIVEGATSEPGPWENCGYAVQREPVPIAMTGDPPNFFWWLQVSYIASEDGQIQVTWDGQTQDFPVEEGAHRLFVEGGGAYDDLTLTVGDDAPDLALCVDSVAIGDLVPFVP